MTITQKGLDKIWENITNREYQNIRKQFPETVIIAPEKLYSDASTSEDMMSIPNANGTNRDYYVRKRPGKWQQTWK